MQDEQATGLVSFDARGIICGRAALDWMTGNWTVLAGGAITCNIWGRDEAERILRSCGAVTVRESVGKE